MDELSKIQENFQYFYPCLMSIEANTDKLKKINHSIILSYLLGYFSKFQINFDDFNIIYNKYQNENFNQSEFASDFERICLIFCDYYETNKERQKQSSMNSINNNNGLNNSNNFNLFKEYKPSNNNSNINNESLIINQKQPNNLSNSNNISNSINNVINKINNNIIQIAI